jgi:signal transduction histidine kinase
LHCAEDILDLVKSEPKIPRECQDQINEAADTITLCVAHQKNIVDDILSFSKLDSSMLSLAPRSVQPKRQLAESLKMFQQEFRKLSITFEYKVDWTYSDFEVDWVKADLVRITQVLVNLITNAIKFTSKKGGHKVSSEPTRSFSSCLLTRFGQGDHCCHGCFA